jgi:outer membrane protein, multidrug efflux system
MRRICTAAVLSLLLAGCTVGPKYQRPPLQPPTEFYAERQITTSSEADVAWWDLFKDPALQRLIREALKNNYDLQTAVARVEQERALAGVTRSEYFPQVGYGASVYGQKDPFPLIANHTYYSYNLNTIWEMDLFGRIRRLNEAQRAVYFGSEEGKRDVRLLVLAEVAQGYFQLRALDADLEVSRRTVKTFQDTLDIFQHKFEGGAASGLEVARARAALTNVAAAIPDLQRQIVAQEAALNLLMGRNPGPIDRGSTLSEQFDPPEVPTGLPSQLLERRPDVREAEETLIAANANVGVAKANFLPTISLTGVFGGISPQLSELTAGGKAWNLAGNLAGPLFTAGRLKNEYRAAMAQRDQATLAFEKTVTQAFGEVSSSLSAHQELAKAYQSQLTSVAAYRESVQLSTVRYDSGLASYLEIIDAEIQMYPAELSAIIYDLGRKVALVNLYRALGGSWNLNDSQWMNGASAAAPSPTP